MMTPALLSAVLLLLLLPAAPADSSNQTHFTVVVTNAVTDSANQTYCTHVVYRGILLGGMRRLQDSNTGFNFTYTEDPNYGPFLQSVNGLAGNSKDRTYWELLVKKPNGTVIRPDVVNSNLATYHADVKEQCLTLEVTEQALDFDDFRVTPGIGCYIPSANDEVILKFNTY